MNRSHTQRGAVLFVALMILILMALLGLMVTRTSLFQGRASNATINRAVAFQSAEDAVAAGIDALNRESLASLCASSSSVAHRADPADTTLATMLDRSTWSTSAGTAHSLGTTPTLAPASAPRYYVQAAQFAPDAGIEAGAGSLAAYGAPSGGSFGCGLGGGTGTMYFLVTGRGRGTEASPTSPTGTAPSDSAEKTPLASAAVQAVVARRR